MKYIINGMVEYAPENGTLLNPESSLNVITLSRATAELLLILIKNNRRPLSREALLHDLWESKGLSASSNNLNNYMSMLRKALAECGCTDLITTIPKYGFVFEAKIERKADIAPPATPPEEECIDISSGTTSIMPGAQASLKRNGKGRLQNPLVVGLFVATALIVFFAAGTKLYEMFRLSTIRSDLFQLGQCRFYAGDDQTRSMDQHDVIRRIKNLITADKITCPVKANVYYFSDKLQDASGHAMVDDLLSYCPYDSKAPCVNYYSSTRVIYDDDKK